MRPSGFRSVFSSQLLRLSILAILLVLTEPVRAAFLVVGERYNVAFEGFTGHTLSASFVITGAFDNFKFATGDWDFIVDGQHASPVAGLIFAFETSPASLGASIGIFGGTGSRFLQDGLLFDEFNPPKAYYTIDISDFETTFPITYSVSPAVAVPEPEQVSLLFAGLMMVAWACRGRASGR